MLLSLEIRQIALIDEVHIAFHQGMQVLTGETGAGKSIVVDAVSLILGGRADRELIRSGSERASVEAVFDISGNKAASDFLNREEIEYDQSFVTIYREITVSGKNTCRICGVLVPLSKIRELSAVLMDLHGQSEQQFLADPEQQISYLDQTGGPDHMELLRMTKESCERFLSNHRAYAKLVRQNEHKDERISALEYDLGLLRKASIKKGELQSLTDQRKNQETAAKKSEALNRIRLLICGEDGETGCLRNMKEISGLLNSLKYTEDAGIHQQAEKIDSLYYELEETAFQISQLCEANNTEPDILEKTDKRLDLIHRLEHRFNTDSDSFTDLEKQFEEELNDLNEAGKLIEKMASEHKKLLSEYRANARALTESRVKLAAEFEKKMMHELDELGMGHTVFKIDFKRNDTGRPVMPAPRGDDHIKFMISPNPGEPLKPIARIASGGELSRIMLAVKTLESARSGVDSMVFDEIDTGISGRMAQVVAEKMIGISRSKQVICVTHLPQIAASADYHYLVIKTVNRERTLTSVAELDENGRIEELGRMISGADGITAESMEYGSSLLNAASALKTKKN